MNRRNFIRLCCGGFGLASLFTLLKKRRALAEPIKPLEVYVGELKAAPGYVIYDMVEVNPDGSTTNAVYTFLKGPKFTNIEEDYKEIRRQVELYSTNYYPAGPVLNNNIITLQSIQYRASRKSLDNLKS